jgi:hypothetical protein
LSIAATKGQLRSLAEAHTMSPQGFKRVQGLRRVVYGADPANHQHQRDADAGRALVPAIYRSGGRIS